MSQKKNKYFQLVILALAILSFFSASRAYAADHSNNPAKRLFEEDRKKVKKAKEKRQHKILKSSDKIMWWEPSYD